MDELTLQIYHAPSGQWSGVVSEGSNELARLAGCASPRETADTAREQFPSIHVVRHAQTPARVVAALDGRGDASQLDVDESELFDELLGEALETPTAEELAFFAKMHEEGGGIGYDEQGRLVRGLPGGGVEVLREAGDPEG